MTRLSVLGVTEDQVGDVVEAVSARAELHNMDDPPSTDEVARMVSAAL